MHQQKGIWIMHLNIVTNPTPQWQGKNNQFNALQVKVEKYMANKPPHAYAMDGQKWHAMYML